MVGEIKKGRPIHINTDKNGPLCDSPCFDADTGFDVSDCPPIQQGSEMTKKLTHPNCSSTGESRSDPQDSYNKKRQLHETNKEPGQEPAGERLKQESPLINVGVFTIPQDPIRKTSTVDVASQMSAGTSTGGLVSSVPVHPLPGQVAPVCGDPRGGGAYAPPHPTPPHPTPPHRTPPHPNPPVPQPGAFY